MTGSADSPSPDVVLRWSDVVPIHRSWRGVSVIEGKVVSLLCNQRKEGGYSDRVGLDELEYRVTANTLPEDVRALLAAVADGVVARVWEKLGTNQWRDLGNWRMLEVRDGGGGALVFVLRPQRAP